MFDPHHGSGNLLSQHQSGVSHSHHKHVMMDVDSAKFQTPKGPNLFHQSSTVSGAGAGVMTPELMSISKDNQLAANMSSAGIAAASHMMSDQKMLTMTGEKSSVAGGASSSATGKTTCNCKKSKCLKLYCECFANGTGCGPDCNCQDCVNKEGNEER